LKLLEYKPDDSEKRNFEKMRKTMLYVEANN